MWVVRLSRSLGNGSPSSLGSPLMMKASCHLLSSSPHSVPASLTHKARPCRLSLGLPLEPTSLPSSSAVCESPSPSGSLCFHPSVQLPLACSHPIFLLLPSLPAPSLSLGDWSCPCLSPPALWIACLPFPAVWSLQALCSALLPCSHSPGSHAIPRISCLLVFSFVSLTFPFCVVLSSDLPTGLMSLCLFPLIFCLLLTQRE